MKEGGIQVCVGRGPCLHAVVCLGRDGACLLVWGRGEGVGGGQGGSTRMRVGGGRGGFRLECGSWAGPH